MSQYVDHRMQAWIGRTLVDRAGQRIGRVEDIYTDDVSHHPAWLAVATGRFGLTITFLPLAGATPIGADELQVQFSRNLVKEAPLAGRNARLSQDDVIRLYEHYGFDLEAEEVRDRAAAAPPARPTVTEWSPPPPVAARPAPSPVAVMERPSRPAPKKQRAAAAAARPSTAAVQQRQAAVRERLFDAPSPGAPAPAPAPAPRRAPAPAPAPPRKRVAEARVTVPPAPAPERVFEAPAPVPPARPAPKAEEPRPNPDNPLFWNHDDRIDSIRPPVDWRPARRR